MKDFLNSCLGKTHLFLFVGLVLSNLLSVNAQVKKIKEQSMITGKDITISVSNADKNALKTVKRYKPILLFRRDASGLSLGNPCVEEVMRRYKCDFEIVPRGQGISGFRYFINNVWSDTKLFFRNGIGWKGRMNKKIAVCRRKTGDFVGFNTDLSNFDTDKSAPY